MTSSHPRVPLAPLLWVLVLIVSSSLRVWRGDRAGEVGSGKGVSSSSAIIK